METGFPEQPETQEGQTPPTQAPGIKGRQRFAIILLLVFGVLILAFLVVAFIYLANPSTPPTTVQKIRDILIIFMALEFMVLGLALVIMIIQLASLLNLLNNEFIPILESTNEAANTLRGTALFLSEHLTEPVIKLNEYGSSLRRLGELIGLMRRR